MVSLDCMWKYLAAFSIGFGTGMLCKIMKPECIHDMKESVSNITKKANEKVQNMMN